MFEKWLKWSALVMVLAAVIAVFGEAVVPAAVLLIFWRAVRQTSKKTKKQPPGKARP